MKSFFTSQFNYCPLTWKFHNRTLKNKINKLHERALRFVYEDINLSFQDLLDRDNSMTIHRRNIQKLAIEMYKIKNKLSPIPMMDIIRDHVNTYDLRNKRCWENWESKKLSQIQGSKNLGHGPSKSRRGNQSSAHVGCVKHLFQN